MHCSFTHLPCTASRQNCYCDECYYRFGRIRTLSFTASGLGAMNLGAFIIRIGFWGIQYQGNPNIALVIIYPDPKAMLRIPI